jgi:methionine synthase I (cobalamin-dependent)/5,10-methylenetetrahydrofolate reductase
MNQTLADRIADGQVHVIDGAMGTVLYGSGVFVNVCYDELNLKNPDLVRSIHQDYLRAGADVLETNTFGANPMKLSSFGLEAEVERINQAAATIAREVANHHASVVGAIGPLGVRLEPFGPTAREEAIEFFGRQVSGLLAGGVHGFLLETFSDLEELHAAFRAVRGLSDLPIIAQMTVNEEGSTAYGTDVETIARTITEWEADVIGLNCSVGPAGMLDAIERMARVTDRPLSVQPNAGLPRSVGHRQIYFASPDYMARYARRLIEAGARFVGGCCGTTPEHIKRIRDEVATLQPRQHQVMVTRSEIKPPAGVEPAPLAERSAWGRKLSVGKFVESVELMPPKGWVPSRLLAHARRLKVAGIDAVAVVDGPRARSRMGALPSAMIIERQVGVETLVHYTCRDRNMLSMMSDLLGAAAGGLRNILVTTGDAPVLGTSPSASSVFDVDSIGLANVVHRLNHGLDPGGNAIGEPTQYVIGVAVNPAALDLDKELRRFYWKVDAGAEYAITQPVFDAAQFETVLPRIKEFGIPIVIGLFPLLSVRNAEFLANEVPGMRVPESVIERLRAAEGRGKEAAVAEGIQIARETLNQLGGAVQGVQISTPSDRIDVVLEVLGRGTG